MQPKKPIPVKYFYYGMLITALSIGGLFFYLWKKESKEEELLKEKGVTTRAWVTNLYSRKAGKKSSPNYYLEVTFFNAPASAVTPENTATLAIDSANKLLAENRAQLAAPLGNLELQTIALSGYDAYKRYNINDTIKVVYLRDEPAIIRLASSLY